jgi:hypothetical protein
VKRVGPATTSYIAYLLLLVAFVLLGIFLAALARGSATALIAAGGLLLFLALSVAGFRAGAQKLAHARAAAGATHKASFWADPLRAEQAEQYQRRYRGPQADGSSGARTATSILLTHDGLACCGDRKTSIPRNPGTRNRVAAVSGSPNNGM